MSDDDDDWEKEEDDWEKDDAEPIVPIISSGVKKLDDEEEEEDEVPAISSNSKYHGLGIAALVKELERRDTDEAKANAGPKELSAKDKRRKRKEQEDAEREKRRHEEAMTAEERQESDQEKFARKMQQQRLVEDADLELAMELMGGCDDPDEKKDEVKEVMLIEAMAPKTEADFEAFGKAILLKSIKYEKSIFYVQFISDLVRELCANLKAEEVKKINSALSVLMNDKNKALQSKPKKKGKGAKLGGGGSKSFAKDAFQGADVEGGGDFDALDDFM
eukprot:m.176580 g.176580  ORF g.176580 m.176580 type:complete len:276 (-) comp24452_c0_seq1:1950-2777(-)